MTWVLVIWVGLENIHFSVGAGWWVAEKPEETRGPSEVVWTPVEICDYSACGLGWVVMASSWVVLVVVEMYPVVVVVEYCVV